METIKKTVSAINLVDAVRHYLRVNPWCDKYDVEIVGETTTIKPHKIPTFQERRNLAHAILCEADPYATFTSIGVTTFCVAPGPGKGHDRVGYAICRNDERFDSAIGKAIAYERCFFGKVIHEDLLGKE